MIVKTCYNDECCKKFECGAGTKKPAHSKFCSAQCAEDFYRDVPTCGPPSGCKL